MNQILSVEMSNNKKRKSNKKASIKAIVIFFCIIILLFGASIIAIGVFTNNNENSNSNSSILVSETNTIEENEVKPNIEIIEGTTSLNVTITSQIEIANVIYKWNDGEETQVNGNGETSIELDITIPIGTNTLNIIATDINGGEQSLEKEYTGVDRYEPTISLGQIDNTLNIICTSEETISYISYIYDDDTEKTQDIDDSTAEISIDAEEGEHTLSIVVVNTDGGKYEETKELYIPTATVVTDKTNFIINASDSREIETINITFNGEEQEEIEVNDTTYESTLKLQDGENKIILVVTNSDGLSITKWVRYEK